MTDELILALMPTSRGACGVPAAVVVTADCGHECWMSPASVATQLATPSRTMCVDCVPAGLDTSTATYTRQELDRLVGPDTAQRLIATVKRHAAQGGTF